MPPPIILGFETGESLSSLDTITFGIGVTSGTVTMPFTPLVFTPERIAEVLGPRNAYALGRSSFSDRGFYNDVYSGISSMDKKRFWGPKQEITKRAGGYAIGINVGGALQGAADAIAEVTQAGLRRLLRELLNTVGLDALQESVSMQATLQGMNGHDTYNFRATDFSTQTNICFINIGAGFITQAALNIAFFGNFPPMSTGLLGLNRYIQYTVLPQAIAWTIVGDAAIGVIPPGMSVSIVASTAS